MAAISDVPEGVLLEILSSVPHRDLILQCRLVCSVWRDVIDSHTLWKMKCQRDGFLPKDWRKNPPDWRMFYVLSYKKRNLLRNPCATVTNRYRYKLLLCYAVVKLTTERDRTQQRRRRRSCWMKEWLLQRETRSHVPPEIRENNPDDYRSLLRMNDATFQELLRLVTPYIRRQDTKMRRAISAEERLVVTLRFLATGRSLADLKRGSLISPQALGLIIPETCKAIMTVLKYRYCKFPTTVQEWKTIAEEFEQRWSLPNCGGVIDGKHVRITPPANTGYHYYNYKGFCSIVLMAVVNANCEFLYIDVGKNGAATDGGSFKQTVFYERLNSKTINLPPVEETKHGLNFVFVADEAFTLHEHILKPYHQTGLRKEQQIFNHRLSKARRVVETTFGLLSSRFRIFHTAINLRVDKIDWVILACCILHNFLLRKTNQQRTSGTAMPEDPDQPEALDQWSSVAAPEVLDTGTPEANQVREQYLAYYNGVGAVPWQEDCLK
ncbi:putative nuclease HARBI1 isoform X1 [Pseudophryne corroboree]|uniref:putative nuclease HARBI1 isoform X1 n=1 Tax=Pseudophryne corroboree TaxID=495146 RepID=UPI003081209C